MTEKNKTREAIEQALNEASNQEADETETTEVVEPAEVAQEQPEQAEEVAETAPAEQISSDQTVGEQGAPEPQTETIEPPNSWTRETKDLFKTLPIEVQKHLAEKEVNQQRYFTRRATEIANRERAIGEIEEAVSPYRERLQNFGITPGAAFSTLMQAQAQLDADPVAGVMHILNSYGLDINDFANQAQQYLSSPSYNPQMLQLQHELGQMRSILTEREKAEAVKHEQELVRMIDNWASASDANGNALFPLVQDKMFSAEMADQISLIKQRYGNMPVQDLLQEAYKRTASYFSVPTASVNKDISKMEKIAKAKKAGKSLSNSGGSEEAPRKFKNTREAAEAAISQHFK